MALTDIPEGTQLLGVDGDVAHLQGPGGMPLSLPVASLSPAAQAQLGLAGGGGGTSGSGAPGALGGGTSGGGGMAPPMGDAGGGGGYGPAPVGPGPMGTPALGGTGGARAGVGEAPPPPPLPAPSAPLRQTVPVTNLGAQPAAPGQNGFGVQLPPRGAGGGGGPDFGKQYAAATRNYGDVLQQNADQDAQAQHQMARNNANIAGQLQQAYVDSVNRRAAVESEYRANISRLDQAQRALDAQKEDPMHWFHSQDAAGKGAALLSVALGAIGQGLTGHNASPVMDFINKDIEAQRQNYQHARDSIATQRSAYGQLREMGLSDAEATLTLKHGQLGALQQQWNSLVTADAPTEKQMAAKEQIARLGQEQLKVADEMTTHEAARTHENVSTALERQSLLQQQQSRAMLAGGQVPPEMRDRAMVMPNGQVVLAGNAGEKEKLVGIHRATSDISDSLEKMQKIAQQNPMDVLRPGSEAYRNYNLLKDNIINQVNASKGINAQMSEPQRELYSKGLDPTALGSTSALVGAIRSFKRETLGSANKAFQLSTGVQPFPVEGEGNQAQQAALARAGIGGR